jgi:hypothetical protein
VSHFYPREDDGVIAADPLDCESCQESKTGRCRYHVALPIKDSPPEKLVSGFSEFDEATALEDDWS